MQEVTLNEIRVIGDIADTIAEQVETLSIDQAVAFRDLLEQVGKKVANARSLCEGQAKLLLDGQPIQIEDKVYVEEATGKWRPQQERIRQRVASLSASDENGEILPAHSAAQRAVDFMYALFVSPSQMPKQAGMKSLGLKTEDIAEWERTGSQLRVIKK